MENKMFIGMVLTFKEPEMYILDAKQIQNIKEENKIKLINFLKSNDIKISKELQWIDDCCDEDITYDFRCEQLNGEIETSASKECLQNMLSQLQKDIDYCTILEID